jgi:hypothetical protein
MVGVATAVVQPLAQFPVANEARQLCAQGLGIARLEEEATLAVVERLLVLREPRRHRHRSAGDRTQEVLRRRRGTGRCRDRDLRLGEVLRLRAVRRAGERHALTQRARQRHRSEVVRQPRPDRRMPGQVRRQLSQRSQEHAQSAALLLGRVEDVDDLAIPACRALHEVGSRGDHLVVAREVAVDQVAGRTEARRARVEPAEEELHEPPCDLRREHALRGRVEAADVQRAGMAQCGRRCARCERLVHVHEVERRRLEHGLDRS